MAMKKTAVTPIVNPKSLEKSILKDLKGPGPQRDFVARYVGAVKHEARQPDEMSQLEFWGHKIPTHRAIAAKTVESLSHLPIEKQWDLWLGVWKTTNNYDVRSIALIWMSNKKQKAIRKEKFKDLLGMVSEIDNWALSDNVSGMLAEILEENPKLLATYKKWNKSRNPWERRQSIVGIYFYARFRKKPIPVEVSLPMIEALLDDPHFYVQRGVGWALREVDRVNPSKQRLFVKKHLHRISGVAWFATTELYQEKDRKKLVLLRKETRAEKRNR